MTGTVMPHAIAALTPPVHATCRYTHTGGMIISGVNLGLALGARPEYLVPALGAAVFFTLLAGIVIGRRLAADPTNNTPQPAGRTVRSGWWWCAIACDTTWLAVTVFALAHTLHQLATGRLDTDRVFTDTDFIVSGVASVGVAGGLMLWRAAHRHAH